MDEMIKNTVLDAELVLVGIGEECDREAQERENTESEGSQTDGILQMYRRLASLLVNENYFIVSACMDGQIHQAGLKEERIVEPCGGYRFLQCREGCTTELYPVEGCLNKNGKMTTCPYCGQPLIYNNIKAQKYVEEGYLEQWRLYTKWLQETLNKKVCILEIGVGMNYPTVIRWPFEKICFFNQKSTMYRVHSSLYQIAEETKDRCYGIKMFPADFLK